MPSIRIKSYRFVFPTILSVIFMASTVQAQNKTQIAEACIQASEAGDTDTATMLAAQIMDWGTLFGPNIIKKAEQCLQTATGEYWKYFTTKGRFLSDDEARAEQAFIDAAGDRKETQKNL